MYCIHVEGMQGKHDSWTWEIQMSNCLTASITMKHCMVRYPQPPSIILVPIPSKGTRWYQCCCWRTVTQKQTGGHTLVSRTPWTQILSLDAVSSCYTCVTKQGKNYAQSRRSIFLLLAPLPSLHALTQTVQLLLRSWCTSWRATLPWAAGTAVVTSFTGI